MKYFENEGALFRGYFISHPLEVYVPRTRSWEPYKGEVPKPFGWGDEITKAEVDAWIADGK